MMPISWTVLSCGLDPVVQRPSDDRNERKKVENIDETTPFEWPASRLPRVLSRGRAEAYASRAVRAGNAVWCDDQTGRSPSRWPVFILRGFVLIALLPQHPHAESLGRASASAAVARCELYRCHVQHLTLPNTSVGACGVPY